MFLVNDLLQIYTLSLVSIFLLYSFFELKKTGDRKTSPRVIIINTFLCITFILTAVAFFSGHQEKVVTDSLIQTNTAQFIGTVLAIFFSLAIVPVSNVVTNTSSAFISQILRNDIFTKSVLFYALIFLAISAQGLFGFNKTVLIINLAYLTMSLIAFILLIYETLRLMDIKNVISDFEKDATYNLEQRWKKITSKAKNLDKQLQLMVVIKNTLILETKSKIEPIFVTTKRYILLDHHDIVAKGLASIVKIATKYIDLFSFSIQDNDRLLIYLVERFMDLKSAITDTSHYSVLPNLVFATKQLAIKSLEIQTPMTKYHRSYLPLSLINFLKDFVVSKEIFKETSSAPLDAVAALEEIALVAIQKKNFNIAHSTLDRLSEISVDCTKLNFFYSNQISKEANAAIMNTHYNMLKTFGRHYHLTSLLANSITNPIKAFIDVGDDSPYKDNLSPFIGTGVDTLGISDPYSTRFFKHLPFIVFILIARGETTEDTVLSYLEEILTEINQLLMQATNKKLFYLAQEIADSSYDLAFTIMQFVEMKKIKDKEAVKQIINDRFYYIFLNSFSSAFAVDRGELYEKIHKWFSVLGLYLITFQTWDGFPTKTINAVIKRSEEALPAVSEQHQGHEFINHEVANDLESTFEYLNLALYWELSLLQNTLLESVIVRFVVPNEEKLHMGFCDNRLPKPLTALGEYWMLDQPYVVYFQQFLWGSRDFLDVNEHTLCPFNEFMEKNELIWKLIQLIKFHTGEVETYKPYARRFSASFGLL